VSRITVENGLTLCSRRMQSDCRPRPRKRREGQKIYHEPSVVEYGRGREILARFPDAQRIEVPSHWNIPQLHGDTNGVGDWSKTK
jgi:spore photoproduct lyase